MASGRRLAVLVVAVALVGAPAVVLRAFCVGNSCDQGEAVAAPVPFCPLPEDLRAEIEAGYRQGRSPEVMGATRREGIAGADEVPWPQAPYAWSANAVPILFFGHGVVPGRLPDGTGVDRIAPTIADLIGFDRPHPEVRRGTALRGVVVSGEGSPLVVEIAWQGTGSGSFTPASTPWLLTSHRLHGSWTFDGTTGSLPVDPAAVLTTIGTGGLPSQHGITGTMIRDANGAAVRAWSDQAPPPIIATLADDWDHATGHRARIGLVAPDETDRGLIGGTWYIDHGRTDLALGRGDPVPEVARLVRSGYGADRTTDLLGVVLNGLTQRMDRRTGAIVEAVRRLVPDATFVLTATGTAIGAGTDARDVVADVNAAVGAPVVDSTVAGGLFLDERVMATHDITSDDVVRAMDALASPGGTPLFADAFPGFAVAFSRYC